MCLCYLHLYMKGLSSYSNLTLKRIDQCILFTLFIGNDHFQINSGQLVLWNFQFCFCPRKTTNNQLFSFDGVQTTFHRLTCQVYSGLIMQVIISATPCLSSSVSCHFALYRASSDLGFLLSSGPRWLLAPWVEELYPCT